MSNAGPTPTPGLARRACRELLLMAFCAALSVAYTWPLARSLDVAVSDPGDPLLNTWILDWSMHALVRDPLHLFDAPMFAGARYSLAFSEHLVGIALLVLPFKLAGATPLEAYNIAMLIGFALNAYGATVLARTVGASLPASIVAAISFGFCQFFFDHLSHLQIVSSGWLPLVLAALIRLLRAPSRGSAVVFAAAFVMNGLTNVYWMLFAGFASVATVAFAAWIEPECRRLRVLAPVAGGFALAAAILTPFLVPYAIVSREYGMTRTWGEVQASSAHLIDYFRANRLNMIRGQGGMAYIPERQLATGFLPLALAAAALFLMPRRSAPAMGVNHRPVSRRLLKTLDVSAVVLGILGYFGATSAEGVKIEVGDTTFVPLQSGATPLFLMLIVILWRWSLALPQVFGSASGRRLRELIRESRFWPNPWLGILWIVIGVTGSLGAHAFVHGFLFYNVHPFRATRVTARWAVIVYVGLVVLSALGAELLLRRQRRARRALLAAAFALVAVADTASHLSWYHMPPDPVPVYEWLRQEGVAGPIFELPMEGDGAPYTYLLGLAEHKVPLINGTSGFSPPSDDALRAMSRRNEFNDAFLALLHARKVQLIVVHADSLGPQRDAVLDWLAQGERDGEFVLLRRFDRGPRGDFVFAVTDTARDWQRLQRANTAADAAGFTHADNWRRLLEDQPIYSERPLLVVDEPLADREYHRRLVIRGWAAAPRGVRAVDVLVDSGRHVYRAERRPRPEVSAAYPWYRHDPLPGFELVLPKRPKGVRKHTNVQVRLTDAAGQTIHSDQRVIYWH